MDNEKSSLRRKAPTSVHLDPTLLKRVRVAVAERETSITSAFEEALAWWLSQPDQDSASTQVKSLDISSSETVNWWPNLQIDGKPIGKELLRHFLKLARIFRSKDPDAWPAVMQNLVCFYRLIGGVPLDEQALADAFGLGEEGETSGDSGSTAANRPNAGDVRPTRKRNAS